MPAVVGVACVLQGILGSTPSCLPRGGGPSAGGVELRSCCLPIDAASALRPGYALEGEGGRRRGGVQARCCQGSAAAHATDLTLTFAQRGAAVSTTRLRTHGLESGACRRPETERQGLPMRPSHDSRAAFREFVTHSGTARPPQFDYRDPRGRYMRLVTLLRAPFAAPIAPSRRGGLVQNRPPRQKHFWRKRTLATPPPQCFRPLRRRWLGIHGPATTINQYAKLLRIVLSIPGLWVGYIGRQAF